MAPAPSENECLIKIGSHDCAKFENREDVNGIAADAFPVKFSPKSHTKTGANNYLIVPTTLMTDLRERVRDIVRGAAVDEDA